MADPKDAEIARLKAAFELVSNHRDKYAKEIDRLTAERDAALAQVAEAETFQGRVQPWMQVCFGPEVSADRLERGDRLLEEVFELLQSGGYPRERVASLTGYVWSRPAGVPAQEVGGVMVTLAAYCLAHGLDMHEAAETELARIWTKVKKIRAKQKAKPTGSALPQEWPTPAPVVPAEGPISTLEMVYRNMPDIPELPEAYQPRNIARSLAALRSAPPVGARVSIPSGLIDALRSQRQIDADGCEVAVSRQACDEAAAILAALLPASLPGQMSSHTTTTM